MAPLELQTLSECSSSPTPGWLNPRTESTDRDRRAHERLMARELEWLKSIRLKSGGSVSLIDLSAGGALIETRTPLRPGSTTVVTISGRGVVETASLRVLRCEVTKLDHGLVYRGACVFDRAITLPDRSRSGGRSSHALRTMEPNITAVPEAPELSEALQMIRAQAARPETADAPPLAALLASADAALDGTPAPGPATAVWNRLVVRYMDGRTLKGFSHDFHPSRPHFHLTPLIGGITHQPVLVPMPRLKAVFFVRDFSGDSGYVDRKSFVEQVAGRRIEITFLDDEVMLGATLSYRPDGTGFFVSPADTNGNNLRVFVLPAAVRHIRYI
ncbi:MAG: DUF6982 domain-containing protein [Vicinamibacterales bacterium]